MQTELSIKKKVSPRRVRFKAGGDGLQASASTFSQKKAPRYPMCRFLGNSKVGWVRAMLRRGSNDGRSRRSMARCDLNLAWFVDYKQERESLLWIIEKTIGNVC